MCRIQNQTGRSSNKWDKTGLVVQVGANDQYVVKVRGSGRLTLRNRKYLRRVEGQKPPWGQIVPYVAEHRNEIGEEKQVETSHEVIPHEKKL